MSKNLSFVKFGGVCRSVAIATCSRRRQRRQQGAVARVMGMQAVLTAMFVILPHGRLTRRVPAGTCVTSAAGAAQQLSASDSTQALRSSPLRQIRRRRCAAALCVKFDADAAPPYPCFCYWLVCLKCHVMWQAAASAAEQQASKK